MKAIGIDIGTTSIGVVSIDTVSGAVEQSLTTANCAALPGKAYENLQDAAVILATVRELLGKLRAELGEPPACIGMTGQMHGILYLDSEGEVVSPLYTWQDASGSRLSGEGQTYAQRLSALTGHSPLATGYGAVTYFTHAQTGAVPANAAVFCTIGDYVAMKLTGGSAPQVHPSNAASMGLFDPASGGFDRAAIGRAGLDSTLFPTVADGFALAGKTVDGVPVSVAIGDNQASFLGSVREMESSILINVGTGGQISLATQDPATASPLIEARPNTGSGDFILVGSSLCAGSSYALLEQFFAGVIEMATGEKPESLYAAMDKLAMQPPDDTEPLTVSTLFRGTRQNPALRAAIGGIGADNFTPQHLILGLLRGMGQEFLDLFHLMELPAGRRFTRLVCSGNGVRRNAPLRKVLEELFGMPLCIPAHKEEACYGAALYALTATGAFPGIAEAQKLIRYQQDG